MPNPNQVALITGAGRGIGRGVAIAMARAGYRLALAARSADQLEETRKLTGLPAEQVLVAPTDLARPDAAPALLQKVVDRFGRIDVLISNAGGTIHNRLHAQTAEQQAQIIGVNFQTPITLITLAAQQMIKQGGGGTVINMSSRTPKIVIMSVAVYAACKAGMDAFIHKCWQELGDRQIKFSSIVLGMVDTAAIEENPMVDRTKLISPDNVAQVVLQIIDSPPAICPIEIELVNQVDPASGNWRTAR